MESRYFNQRFNGLEGGLFSPVEKADVGEGAARLQAQGYDLLGWADPFFPDPSLPESVCRAMTEALASGMPAHYTMPIGSLELRTELAEKCRRYNQLEVDPSRNVLVTPGSDSGLLFAMMPFLDTGDEVLVPDPSYPSNFLNCRLCGAKAVPVPLDAANHYRLDVEAFRARLTSRTKMVVLTHPNNPTGTVFSREELEALSRLICENDLILVCDQAFEDHVFDGREMVTPASLPGMWERTVTTFSISKGLGLSGLRVGYLVACDAFMDVFYAAAVNVLGATNTVAQIGALAALRDKTLLPRYHQVLERRRNLAYEAFSAVPGVGVERPQSGILSWLDVSRLGTDTQVADYLREHAHVVVNEGRNYGAQGAGHLRLVHACFASDEKARSVFARIADSLREMGRGGR